MAEFLGNHGKVYYIQSEIATLPFLSIDTIILSLHIRGSDRKDLLKDR